MAEKKLVLRSIQADEPGYLRRLRQIGHMRRVLATGWTDDDIESVVKLLLEFVEKPTDKAEAEELLWEASLEQFLAMLSAIGGADTGPLPVSE